MAIANDKIVEEIKYVFYNYLNLILKYKGDEKNIDIQFNSRQSFADAVTFKYYSNYTITIHGFNVEDKIKAIANSIASKLSRSTKKIIKNEIQGTYRDALYNWDFLSGLCEQTCNPKFDSEILHKIILCLSNWAIKTYEGHHVKYGIIILDYVDDSTRHKDILSFLKNDVSASIADGEQTFYVVDKCGHLLFIGESDEALTFIKEKIDFEENKAVLSPYKFEKICSLASGGSKSICITLSENCDICCFKNRQLHIARRNGSWSVYSYDRFKNVFYSDNNQLLLNEDLIKEVYNSALDVAFAGTGGCIAIEIPEIAGRKKIDKLLPSNIEYCKKIEIQDLIKSNFAVLSRGIRKELLAIDGACIIKNDGVIKNFGTIINKVKQQNSGGARSAAAFTLSEYGIAIKISADGYIVVYKNGQIVL